MTQRMGRVLLLALSLTVCAVPAFAQVFTGRIDLMVTDGTGAVLPGVTVELTGPQASSTVTNERGEARFLNLAPGQYTVVAKLSGFSDYRNTNVPVGAGSIVTLKATMAVGGMATSVDVQATTPVIETKKQTISTNVTLDELQNIPTSRDPWVVLQTVPSIIVDRVNVGGAESGQQSNYVAKGATGGDNTWNIDGIAITDMGSLGSSPTYYDFDMFQEMQVTTGGADPQTPTPGVQLNFVLRGGTNVWRGSGRYYFENNDLQSDNVPDDLRGTLASYNRVAKYQDYGVEIGGPILRNRLFFWGAFGKTKPEMDIFAYSGGGASRIVPSKGCGPTEPVTVAAGSYGLSARDCTTLENYSAKASAEIDTNTRGSFTFFYGDKIKQGRGASGTRPAETTWNQTGPTKLFKGELSRTIGNSAFVTARYAHVGGGFSLSPQGGNDAAHYRDDARVHHGSYLRYSTDRPQDNATIDGNYFKGNHELKFGFGWKRAAVTSESGWPGLGIQTRHSGYPTMTAIVVRDWAAAAEGQHWNAYVGDTISLDRLTVNVGVRWDRSASSITPASVPGNSVLPNLLPALDAPAVDNAIVWNTVTPRVGVTYALTESRKTIARASYAMFASQLAANQSSLIASAIPYYSYVYYRATDTNGNNVADASEIAAGTFLGTAGFDPSNPLGGNPDTIGDYGVPRTHEVVLGLEHELRANIGLSGSFTWRRYTNFNWQHQRGVTGANYTRAGDVTGSHPAVGNYSVPLYMVNEAALPDDNGRVFEKRPGYHQQYWGLELSATKRMSNNWMMRAGFSTGEHTEYFDNDEARFDPTANLPLAAAPLASPNVNGGLVLTQTSGSGKSNVFLVAPKYQFILTSAYQARYGINLGMNYVARQGYSTPYYLGEQAGTEDALNPSGRNILVTTNIGDARLPMVHSFDARISKTLRIDRVSADLDLDFFNLFNASTVLGRQFDLNASTADQPLEIMNPRVVRLGVRVRF
ncbi:MAG: carboxypeptidase regulatory-like domain-containing protein [Vicinamibacterales bacterium]